MTIEDLEETSVPYEVPEHTHKAVLTLYSNNDTEEVNIRVQWEPDLDGKSIEEIGFIPAAYMFVQQYMLPAIEQGYMDWQADPMMNAEPPSQRRH